MSRIFRFFSNKFVILLILLFATSVLSKFLTGEFIPSNENKNLWFYAGLLMVLISSFFIEEYYTSPRNVLANNLPLLVIFVAVKPIFENNHHQWLWTIGFYYILFIILCSVISILLSNDDISKDHLRNRASQVLRKASSIFGKGRVVYSAMFLYFLFTYYQIQNIYTLLMLLFWWLIIVIEPQKIKPILRFKKTNEMAIGRITSIQSNKMLIVEIYHNVSGINKFDSVVFKYSEQNINNKICNGLILDITNLEDKREAKVLLVGEQICTASEYQIDKNIVYKSNISYDDVYSEKLVGVVTVNSVIGKIIFECYNSVDIHEGSLLEVKIEKRIVYYQVIEGRTFEEKVSNRNETGYIQGEAIQLGEWNNNNCAFEKYGWVAPLNSIVLLADTAHISPPEFAHPYFKLGIIPETTLPVLLNLHDAISHHFAIIGVTGSGKSFITHKILKNLGIDTKIICVDFTGEYSEKLADLNPKSILHDKDGVIALEEMVAQKESEKVPSKILQLKKNIQAKLKGYINDFIKSDDNIGLFELPDLSNTSFILEFTQFFLESVFHYAKENNDNRICIVLEEAHTIVPETSFLGDFGDFGSSKAIVNKIGQIALQGRKYGVGLIVIAQRTANVSKTVLTQCNTILAFQAFDETTFTFIGNYLGKNLVSALPNLPMYHAIISGKAVKSNIPIIVDLTRETVARSGNNSAQ